jgi:3-oxoacyl-[acyl-carrier-protein] synthase II
MTDPTTAVPRRGAESVVVTGAGVLSPFGAGLDALLSGVLAGRPAFAPVERFDVAGRRVRVAALAPGSPVLADELTRVIGQACDQAATTAPQRAGCPLFLAIHGDPGLARVAVADRAGHSAHAFTLGVSVHSGLSGVVRAYTSACVAASTAVADAAAMIARGEVERVVVAAGYLVEADQFAIFDAGRALADDERVRPFSTGRRGLLLGDGVAAVVLESATAARSRAATVLGRVAGWGRAGDAYHPCRPHPQGAGLARAIGAALHRGGVRADEVGYVNAHGSGTGHSDAAETAALYTALGEGAGTVAVSSTKSVHGQALEASGLVELIVTLLCTRAGRLPVNAGYLGPDEDCRLDLIVDGPRAAQPAYALSLNAAFGGANTALLIGAA